jgi:hypothetical protein
VTALAVLGWGSFYAAGVMTYHVVDRLLVVSGW